MSDTSGDDSSGMKKKSSFTVKFDKFSSKLHNPFKKNHSDSSDNEDSKSPARRRHENSPVPRGSGRIAEDAELHDPNISEKPPASGVQSDLQAAITGTPTIPTPGETRTAPSRVPTVADAEEKAVKYAPDGVKALPPGPPSEAAKEVMAAKKPDSGVADAIKAGGSAAAGVDEGKTEEKEEAGGDVTKKEYEVVRGPVHGVAEIVLTGVKGDPEEVMKAFRRRGFVIHLAMLHDETDPPEMTMVLGMGPKLLVKCAVERNLKTKAREEYTSTEVSQLCADAVGVIKRSGIEYGEVSLLHDKEALAEVAQASNKDAANMVFSYFGPYVGLYFAWLRFYTRALIAPTLCGFVLFLSNWKTGSPDGPLLPIFCVLVMVWTTLFLELWRRRNSEIAFRWGVDGVEDEETMRAYAEKAGEFKANPAGKFCVTIPIIFAAIFVIIRYMLYCNWLSDHAQEVYGEDSYMKYWPVLLQSVMPVAASTAYSFLAKALNDFEDHATEIRKKNMLVIKMFAFQFVNSYCALLYVAFWVRDLERLRTLLMTMMMVKQFIAQLVEKYQPVVMRMMKERKQKKNPPKPPRFLVHHTGTVTPDELFEELKTDIASVEDDYLEMVLQFGYVSMFAVVFPLAPFFALLNNMWEIRLDLGMLVKKRRPQAHSESTIGAWQLCLEVIGVVACLTNLLLAVLVSQNVSAYVPTSWTVHMGTFEGKVVLAIVAEHLLLLVKAIMTGLIDKVPRVVREAQAVIAVHRKEENKEFRRRASGLPKSKESKDRGLPAEKETTPSGNLRALHETHGMWHFGPMWYLPLAFMPFIVSWFELSPLLVIPLAFVFVSYLQHVHDKAKGGLALGIVKDPKVLQMVTDFMPPWYTDSEVERVQWLNKIVDKMWVSASAATKELCFTTIQPIIDGYRPAGVSTLGFKKVSLGTIPPKIVGVRALEMKDDKAVFDMDIRWAANAEIVVQAGVKAVPLLITLDKIRFSGTLRVELAPLVPVFPCFGAVVITFMEKPFLDFAFSLGRLDVMSIGPGEASVGAAVSKMIKGIVADMMVFPQKMVIPILYEQDILALSNPTPTGVVELTLVGADNLRSADIAGKSDPYAKIKLGAGQEVKTDTKNGTLNPRWGETFDLLVYERSVEVIEFILFDHDSGPSDDDTLGYCDLPLSVLKPDVESTYNLPLSKTKTGSLLIRATFVPLSSGPKRTIVEAEDVIVDMAGDVITDDNVNDEVYPNVPAALIGEDPSSPKKHSKRSKAIDPSELKPESVLTDTTMGVLSVMGIECRGVKPGDRYVSVICGNTKRKTPIERGKTSFAYADVFHFLIRGAKSAVLEVLLKEDEKIGNDKKVGSFKIRIDEVIANEDQLDGEWDLTGEKAQGSIKMRLKWSGRVGQEEDE